MRAPMYSRRHRPATTVVDIPPSPGRLSASPLISPVLQPMRSVPSSHSLVALDELGAHPCEAGGPRPPPARRVSSASTVEQYDEPSETMPLMRENGPDSGRWYHGPLFRTGVKLGILFAVFSTLVLGTFWFGLPEVEPDDRPALKLPRSFADLQALNVQAFTLPGSMYISILFGAAYGILPGLLLSCICDSCGSLLCYTLSALLAPPLLELPYYRKMLDKWRVKIMGDESKGQGVGRDSVFAFLLVLRIMPFPPHWVANFVTPHLGIGPLMFWTTCFIGIGPMSVIHVMIGSSLDQMTSAEDFKLLSPRNILGLGAVIVAVLIPVGLKRVFRKDLGDLGDEPGDIATVDDIPAPNAVEFGRHGLPRNSTRGKARAVPLLIDIDDEDAGASAYELPSVSPKRDAGYGTIEVEHAAPPSGSWWVPRGRRK